VWIVTTSGFVSIVEHRDDHDEVARCQGSAREHAYHEIWASLRRNLEPLRFCVLAA
jgi:hypothetical protein